MRDGKFADHSEPPVPLWRRLYYIKNLGRPFVVCILFCFVAKDSLDSGEIEPRVRES